MKRIRPETNPKDPSQIRSSSLRGFHGVRSSENRFGPTISRGTKDISRGKRAKFTDPEIDRPPSSRQDAAAIPYEGTEARRSDGPKTSEYAFFKKLKKDAGQTFHSYPLHKEGSQLEKFESSDCAGEMTNMVRHSFKNLKSSALVKNVTPINPDSFPSPLRGTSKNSEMTNMVKHNFKNHKSSLLVEKVYPFPSPLGGPAKNSGTQYWQEEVFSTRRQRLRQWVADTSSPGIDELCSKGYDLVSVLLGRLFPESNENNCCRDPKFRQAEIDTKSELLAFPETDADFKKLHWTTPSNFMEPEHMPYMDDGTLACWSDSSKKVIPSKWDSVGCDSPTSCANKTNLQYKIREFDCDLDGGRTARLCTDSDSAFGFSFEKYRSHSSNHLKELDEFHDPNESALGRQPHTLLLGWNFDDMKDEQSLSIITSHNTEPSSYTTLPNLWCDDQWQSLDNRFDANGLCLSSFLSSYPPNFTSSPCLRSASYCDLDFERHVLEDKKDLEAALNQFPLTLSCTPNYLNLAEDCNYDTTCRDSSNFPSPQNHHWFMSKVISEQCHPYLECLSSYFLPKDEFGSLGETRNQYTKDILNIDDWSSIGFQISLDQEKAFPLLLDKSSWDGSEGEPYFDDSDVNYI